MSDLTGANRPQRDTRYNGQMDYAGELRDYGELAGIATNYSQAFGFPAPPINYEAGIKVGS